MIQFIKVLRLLLALAATQTIAEFPSEEAILKAGGPDAEAIIRKARNLLSTQRVFASRAVGYGGSPTAGCWALSVIVRHDKEAKELLNELLQSEYEPAAKLYAIAGLLIVDPRRKQEFSGDKLEELAKREVDRLEGCITTSSTFGAIVAELIEHGGSRYVYDKLPSLYRTVDLREE